MFCKRVHKYISKDGEDLVVPLKVLKEKKLYTGEGKANTTLDFLATVTQTASKMGAPFP